MTNKCTFTKSLVDNSHATYLDAWWALFDDSHVKDITYLALGILGPNSSTNTPWGCMVYIHYKSLHNKLRHWLVTEYNFISNDPIDEDYAKRIKTLDFSYGHIVPCGPCQIRPINDKSNIIRVQFTSLLSDCINDSPQIHFGREDDIEIDCIPYNWIKQQYKLSVLDIPTKLKEGPTSQETFDAVKTLQILMKAQIPPKPKTVFEFPKYATPKPVTPIYSKPEPVVLEPAKPTSTQSYIPPVMPGTGVAEGMASFYTRRNMWRAMLSKKDNPDIFTFISKGLSAIYQSKIIILQQPEGGFIAQTKGGYDLMHRTAPLSSVLAFAEYAILLGFDLSGGDNEWISNHSHAFDNLQSMLLAWRAAPEHKITSDTPKYETNWGG